MKKMDQSLDESLLEREIKNLKEQGKSKEAQYLRENSHKIEHLFQVSHLWILFWHKFKKFWKSDKFS